MIARLKRSLHFAGGVLAVVGVVFVLMRLWSYGAEINLSTFNFNWVAWTIVGILALVYGVSNLMLALAWRDLLRHFGISVTARWAVWAYGVSQIAKYVPGNIFHLAGRQALGAAAGLPQWPLAKSAVWELGLIAATGGVFGLLVLPVLTGYVSAALALALFIGVLIFAQGILKWFWGRPIAHAFLWYGGFLWLSGAIFAGLLHWLAGPHVFATGGRLILIGAYVLAWLAGLVTPGAPAGIGVRELVLFVLLSGSVGEAELLLAVVLGRFITAMGDTLFFLAAHQIRSAR